jgi:hypothetical protein
MDTARESDVFPGWRGSEITGTTDFVDCWIEESPEVVVHLFPKLGITQVLLRVVRFLRGRLGLRYFRFAHFESGHGGYGWRQLLGGRVDGMELDKIAQKSGKI